MHWRVLSGKVWFKFNFAEHIGIHIFFQNRLSDLYSLCEICGINNPKNIDVERLKELYIKRTKKEVNINMPSLSYETINVDWQNKKEQQISQALHSVILPLTLIKIKREDILLFNYYNNI